MLNNRLENKNLMEKRVVGLIGISSRMSNWNADFSGFPKTTANDEIFGSDKALKFPMKTMWVNDNEKVMYIKSYELKKGDKKNDPETLRPVTLEERYQKLFKEVPIKHKLTEVLDNLFSCLDVMNFGATFPIDSRSISITGAVQVGQGYNIYEDSNFIVQDILAAFYIPKKNTNKEKEDPEVQDENSEMKSTNTSIGKKIISDEAHYCYPFTINPNNYRNFTDGLNNIEFQGYTKFAYDKFKEAARISATNFSTNSKVGCENEYAIFVEMKEGCNKSLPLLDRFVKFKKESGQNVLDISELVAFLTNYIEFVDKVEIYYSPDLIKIEDNYSDNSSNMIYKLLNIFTEREI